MHMCIDNVTIIGSDKGLAPTRQQAIIWTNAGILLIGTSGTNFNEIFSEILTFPFKKIDLNVSSVKWQPFCFCLGVLIKMPVSLFLKNKSMFYLVFEYMVYFPDPDIKKKVSCIVDFSTHQGQISNIDWAWSLPMREIEKKLRSV